MELFILVYFLSSIAFARSAQPSKLECASIAKERTNPAVEISRAVEVPAHGLNISSVVNEIPLCWVQGTIKYNANDKLDVSGNNTLTWELFLPSPDTYNGRYLMTGDGGFAGAIENNTMLTYLNLGYAVAGSDAGHPEAANGDGTYAPFLQNPAELQAWIHNSVAMATPVTRSLVAKYYSKHPDYSYFWGCSTGGAQGYALAQYHPELFDGIYAGSPGNWYSHLVLSFLWNGLHTTGSAFMSQQVLSFVTDRVVAACDQLDGVKDGLIENPLRCSFDVTSLRCKSEQAPDSGEPTCLTADQIAALQKIYEGPKDVRSGNQIYPGFSLGSENGLLDQEQVLYLNYTAPILREVVLDDQDFNITHFNWGSDVDAVDKKASPFIDSLSPNLSQFQRRGGKLLTTQGWSDQYNAALWPIQHLQEIQRTMGPRSDFVQVFMVPGGGHCGPNPYYPHVPGVYHVMEALVPWVEDGKRPRDMLATEPPDRSDTTRKLCPWPATAKHVGGDVDDWKSYDCA
uniref:Carboxylic ester hydrolase n=1 Tax=Talaromyces piceae TaxID=153982 RepID=A0A1S5XVA5_9EURO|nr:feruloyl esterase [Talaromyces piceae]ATQ35973.1 feruloyl esterase [Talaromyces piceae]